MNLMDIIKGAQARKLVDEDGGAVRLEIGLQGQTSLSDCINMKNTDFQPLFTP